MIRCLRVNFSDSNVQQFAEAANAKQLKNNACKRLICLLRSNIHWISTVRPLRPFPLRNDSSAVPNAFTLFRALNSQRENHIHGSSVALHVRATKPHSR